MKRTALIFLGFACQLLEATRNPSPPQPLLHTRVGSGGAITTKGSQRDVVNNNNSDDKSNAPRPVNDAQPSFLIRKRDGHLVPLDETKVRGVGIALVCPLCAFSQ